jgi:signal transduction histidine kinase
MPLRIFSPLNFNPRSNFSSASVVDIVDFNYAMGVCTTLALFVVTPSIRSAVLLWAFFVVFQLALCLLLVNCTGISVVWNANAGALVVFALRSLEPELRAFRLELVAFIVSLALLVDAYYVAAAEALTTIAHIAAIVLGVLTAQIATSSFASTIVSRARNARDRRNSRKSKRNRNQQIDSNQPQQQQQEQQQVLPNEDERETIVVVHSER